MGMLARVITCVLACAALAAAPASAAASASQPPNPSLSAFRCHRAFNPLNRMISVTANVQPLPGTAQMELKFVLLERTPGQGFHRVHGGDLGRWRQLTLASWAVKKPVLNLPAPATYRFRVSFLWLAGSGSVISSQTLLSPLCRQLA